jgi:hypothetical protein
MSLIKFQLAYVIFSDYLVIVSASSSSGVFENDWSWLESLGGWFCLLVSDHCPLSVIRSGTLELSHDEEEMGIGNYNTTLESRKKG